MTYTISTGRRSVSGSRKNAARNSFLLPLHLLPSLLLLLLRTPSSLAGCSSCIIACFALTSGQQQTSMHGAAWWATFISTGERRHLLLPFPSCTCCIIPSTSPSDIASSAVLPKPRSSPSIPPSTTSSTSNIATSRAIQRKGCAAASLIPLFEPCNLFSSDRADPFYFLLTLISTQPRARLAR